MTGRVRANKLPILPLANDAVLLPGVTLRVPVQYRSDIPALLSAAYARAATPRTETTAVSIGCVPLNSPLLGPDGRNLLDGVEGRSRVKAERLEINPGKANKEDLFLYGVVGKISNVQGRRSELALVIEGLRRFKVERFTQEKPYFEAEVTYMDDDGTLADF